MICIYLGSGWTPSHNFISIYTSHDCFQPVTLTRLIINPNHRELEESLQQQNNNGTNDYFMALYFNKCLTAHTSTTNL